jgi:hypothetical protein
MPAIDRGIAAEVAQVERVDERDVAHPGLPGWRPA